MRPDDDWRDHPLSAVSVALTGPDPNADRVCGVSVVTCLDSELRDVARRVWLIDPERPIAPESTARHGIRDADVQGARKFDATVASDIMWAVADSAPVAWSARVHRQALIAEMTRARVDLPSWLRADVRFIDPLVWARDHFNGAGKLARVAGWLNLPDVFGSQIERDAELTLRVLYALGVSGKLPAAYGELVAQQDSMRAQQESEFRNWRRPREGSV